MKTTIGMSLSASLLLAVALAACADDGLNDDEPMASPPGTYTVSLSAATFTDMPSCTPALAGSIAAVESPSALWRCTGETWTQLAKRALPRFGCPIGGARLDCTFGDRGSGVVDPAAVGRATAVAAPGSFAQSGQPKGPGPVGPGGSGGAHDRHI